MKKSDWLPSHLNPLLFACICDATGLFSTTASCYVLYFVELSRWFSGDGDDPRQLQLPRLLARRAHFLYTYPMDRISQPRSPLKRKSIAENLSISPGTSPKHSLSIFEPSRLLTPSPSPLKHRRGTMMNTLACSLAVLASASAFVPPTQLPRVASSNSGVSPPYA